MTKSEMLAASASATSIAISVLLAKQQAEQVLAQAQAEGWTEDDARWQPQFDQVDGVLKAALARL